MCDGKWPRVRLADFVGAIPPPHAAVLFRSMSRFEAQQTLVPDIR
jgi:hypothetical protein